MTSNHTPTPWEVLDVLSNGCEIISPVGDAELGNWYVGQTRYNKDAAFIVRACNSHDDLVAALERWLFNIKELAKLEGYEGLIKQTEQALAKAGAK